MNNTVLMKQTQNSPFQKLCLSCIQVDSGLQNFQRWFCWLTNRKYKKSELCDLLIYF